MSLPGPSRGAAWQLGLGLLLLLAWALPDGALPDGAGAVRDGLLAWMRPAAYAAFAWTFARTLRPGREPLIARYIRFDPRRDLAECAGYARGLTAFWAWVLGLAALGTAAALALGRDPGFLPDLLFLLLFLAEHAVRSLRFPAGGVAWPTQTLGAIIRAERAHHG